MFVLNDDQQNASNRLERAIKKKEYLESPILRIGGIAGSGKTTIANHVFEKMGYNYRNLLPLSYTGQAVRRMRQQGFMAYTMHSTLMRPVKKKVVIDGHIRQKGGIPYYTHKWEFIKELPDWVEAIFFDEGSFLNTHNMENIERLALKKGIPVFVFGDPEQLDPVVGESAFRAEDLLYFIEQPVRQALESDLYRLSYLIRNEKRINPDDFSYFNKNGERRGKGSVLFLHEQDSKTKMRKYYSGLLEHLDTILTNTNQARNMIIELIRQDIMGRDSFVPVRGDKLICRKNNTNLSIAEDYPLMNGTVGYCMRDIPMSDIDIKKRTYTMDFRPMDITDDYFDSLICDLEYLNTPCQSNKPKDKYNPGNKLEYANAITVHASQGMEYDTVGYMERYIPNPVLMRKIRYVASTRAKEQLTWWI